MACAPAPSAAASTSRPLRNVNGISTGNNALASMFFSTILLCMSGNLLGTTMTSGFASRSTVESPRASSGPDDGSHGAGSERLEILDQRLAFLLAKRISEGVPAIAITPARGVVDAARVALVRRSVLAGIQRLIPPTERLAVIFAGRYLVPPVSRPEPAVEQRGDTGNGIVVQVGRGRPDGVQGRRHVTRRGPGLRGAAVE